MRKRSENAKGVKELWRRAERAEEKASVLQEQLKVVSVSSHLDRKASKTQLAQKWGANWGQHPPTWQQARAREHDPQRQHRVSGDGEVGDNHRQGSSGTLGRENHNQRQRWTPGHAAITAEYKPSAEVAALQDVLHRAHDMNRSMLRRVGGQAQADPSVMFDSQQDWASPGLTPPHDRPQTAWQPSIGEQALQQTSPASVLGQGHGWSRTWQHRYVPCHATLASIPNSLKHRTLVSVWRSLQSCSCAIRLLLDAVRLWLYLVCHNLCISRAFLTYLLFLYRSPGYRDLPGSG